MAIDLRNSRNNYATRCKYYKAEYVDNNTRLIPNAIAKGVFYSKDKVPYREYTENANGVARMKVRTVTIETNDYIPDIEADDFVLYDGNLWRVHALTKDDLEKNKYYSSRPTTITTIELRR